MGWKQYPWRSVIADEHVTQAMKAVGAEAVLTLRAF